jgi:hypothetical protein
VYETQAATAIPQVSGTPPLVHRPIDPIRVEPAGRRDGNSLCVSITIKRLLLLECLQKVKKALLNAYVIHSK